MVRDGRQLHGGPLRGAGSGVAAQQGEEPPGGRSGGPHPAPGREEAVPPGSRRHEQRSQAQQLGGEPVRRPGGTRTVPGPPQVPAVHGELQSPGGSQQPVPSGCPRRPPVSGGTGPAARHPAVRSPRRGTRRRDRSGKPRRPGPDGGRPFRTLPERVQRGAEAPQQRPRIPAPCGAWAAAAPPYSSARPRPGRTRVPARAARGRAPPRTPEARPVPWGRRARRGPRSSGAPPAVEARARRRGWGLLLRHGAAPRVRRCTAAVSRSDGCPADRRRRAAGCRPLTGTESFRSRCSSQSAPGLSPPRHGPGRPVSGRGCAGRAARRR